MADLHEITYQTNLMYTLAEAVINSTYQHG